MAQESRPGPGGGSTGGLSAFLSDGAATEDAWRQALLLRDLTRDDRAAARRRRAEAEAARAKAEQEAVAATNALCAELQVEARARLQQAQDALATAEQARSEARSSAESILAEARLAAQSIRSEADTYAGEVKDNARKTAETLLAEARSGAREFADNMRRETADEIRRILASAEAARAAAEEEFETQRIFTETARIRALSPGLSSRSASQPARPGKSVSQAAPGAAAEPGREAANVQKAGGAQSEPVQPDPAISGQLEHLETGGEKPAAAGRKQARSAKRNTKRAA